MNRLKKVFATIIVVNLLLVKRPLNTIALEQCNHNYYCYHDYYLKSSNGSRQGIKRFYIGTSFTDAQKGFISNGICMWNVYPSVMRMQSSNSSSNAEITVGKKYLGSGLVGLTQLRINGVEITHEEEVYGNFSHATIYLDMSMINSNSLLKEVSAHEAGHAIGLSHSTGYSSIMYYATTGPYASNVLTTMDKSVLAHIYC